MLSGSDRACEKWMADYAIPDAADLALHHFYRAMAWLGEELPEAEQAGATPFAPRCVKDLVEDADGARADDRPEVDRQPLAEHRTRPGSRACCHHPERPAHPRGAGDYGRHRATDQRRVRDCAIAAPRRSWWRVRRC
jgi:hypothetical protein